jgi:hypothetical protein
MKFLVDKKNIRIALPGRSFRCDVVGICKALAVSCINLQGRLSCFKDIKLILPVQISSTEDKKEYKADKGIQTALYWPKKKIQALASDNLALKHSQYMTLKIGGRIGGVTFYL